MKNNQNTDEITILKTRYHWKIFIFPVLVLLLAGFLYAKEWFLIWYLSYPIAVIGIIVLAWRLLKYFTNEFTVTSENVIHKYVDVFLGTHNPEKKIHLITDVHPHKPILGQIFNYGNILLNSSESKDFDFRGLSSFEKFEESVHVAREFQKGKLDAQEVRLFSQKTGKLFGNPNESTQNLNSKSNDFKSSEKVENDVKSIKVTPIYSDSERERIRSEFKAYSPPREDYKKYPLPKNGEKWKLERALPSGLILLKNKELSAKKEATSILHDLVDITKEIFTEGVFTEGTEKSVFDERPY